MKKYNFNIRSIANWLSDERKPFQVQKYRKEAFGHRWGVELKDVWCWQFPEHHTEEEREALADVDRDHKYLCWVNRGLLEANELKKESLNRCSHTRYEEIQKKIADCNQEIFEHWTHIRKETQLQFVDDIPNYVKSFFDEQLKHESQELVKYHGVKQEEDKIKPEIWVSEHKLRRFIDMATRWSIDAILLTRTKKNPLGEFTEFIDDAYEDLVAFSIQLREKLSNSINPKPIEIDVKHRFVPMLDQYIDFYNDNEKKLSAFFENQNPYAIMYGIILDTRKEIFKYFEEDKPAKKAPQQSNEPMSFEDMFVDARFVNGAIEVLKKVDPPVLNIEGNYIGKEKGAFCVWIDMMKKRDIVKYYPNNNIYAKLISEKFAPFSISSSMFGKEHKRASGKYQRDFDTLLSKLYQNRK